LVGERGISGAGAEATVGVDAAHLYPRALRFADRAVERAAVDRAVAFGDIGDHEAIRGVGDTRLVANSVGRRGLPIRIGRASGSTSERRSGLEEYSQSDRRAAARDLVPGEHVQVESVDGLELTVR
jgi:hypothetical protein